MHEEIELSRDCEAIQIPSGTSVTLAAGTRVFVTQSLGGSYTVAAPDGLYRITDLNADAIGKEPPARSAAPIDPNAETTEEDIWEQLKTCYDPEIPVNIVDLGLIYDCTLQKKENGKASVTVKMTLTAPGCGMGPTIAAEATEDDVWEQLKTCYDPEIPVNIVDLGLIYDCTLQKKESGKADVTVKMTLTAPGCGMGPTIAAEAKMRIESIPGVDEAAVELVWDPPWDQSMISEVGKMQLGLI